MKVVTDLKIKSVSFDEQGLLKIHFTKVDDQDFSGIKFDKSSRIFVIKSLDGTNSIDVDIETFDFHGVLGTLITKTSSPTVTIELSEQFDDFLQEFATLYPDGMMVAAGDPTEKTFKPSLNALSRMLPGVYNRVKSPCDQTCFVHDDEGLPSLRDTIIHLNDDHKWPREQIADWVEALDVDTKFKVDPLDNAKMLD